MGGWFVVTTTMTNRDRGIKKTVQRLWNFHSYNANSPSENGFIFWNFFADGWRRENRKHEERIQTIHQVMIILVQGLKGGVF